MTQFDPHSTAMGHAVRVAIVSAGTTQTAIAEKVGLSVRSLTRRINGEQDFTWPQLIRIAAAIDLDLLDLIADAQRFAARRAVA